MKFKKGHKPTEAMKEAGGKNLQNWLDKNPAHGHLTHGATSKNIRARYGDGRTSEAKRMNAVMKSLVDDLGGEEKKLEQEIAGTTPKVFQASRVCTQPCYQRCPEPVVIMHPPISQQKVTSVERAQAVSAHAAAHAVPKVEVPAPVEKSSSLWSKFINLRLLGN